MQTITSSSIVHIQAILKHVNSWPIRSSHVHAICMVGPRFDIDKFRRAVNNEYGK